MIILVAVAVAVVVVVVVVVVGSTCVKRLVVTTPLFQIINRFTFLIKKLKQLII